jgi:hypothetical protein
MRTSSAHGKVQATESRRDYDAMREEDIEDQRWDEHSHTATMLSPREHSIRSDQSEQPIVQHIQ